jgi:hypothetical protein
MRSTRCGTSHVERNNLTIRTFMKRFTRLALGFSKKLANLESAVHLHMAYYNFCWRPGKMRITPAMAACVTNGLWSFADLMSGGRDLDSVRRKAGFFMYNGGHGKEAVQ